LKEFLGGRRFTSEEVKGAVKAWLNGLTAEVYDAGVQKLATGCDKWLIVGAYPKLTYDNNLVNEP
jgi:hypothetical protein